MSRSPAPRRRATLASLAAELKVSRTTISNAYNRPDQLSADLRERVLATAKRLGYPGPDPVARSLRTRKAGAVGLVITEPLNYSFSDPAALDFVAGLAESCEEAGQGLLLVAVGPEPRASPTVRRPCWRRAWTGSWCTPPSDDDPYLQVVLQRHAAGRRRRPAQGRAGRLAGLHRRPRGDARARRTRRRAGSPGDRPADDATGPRLAAWWTRPAVRRSGTGADPALPRPERAHPGVHDAMIGCRPGSGLADRRRELRAPADLGRRRRRGRARGQPAHHRADVHRRRAGALGDGLPTRTRHLRARAR